MAKEPTEKPERYTIQSVDKALDLIEILAEQGSLNLLELAERLDQPKSSTYRIVLTLQNRGFIDRDDEDGKYCLGYKQLMITRALLERSTLRGAALPEMKKLSERYGDTVNLGILNEGSVVYVEILESSYMLRMTDTVGSRSPFHATAIGKAITSFMPETDVRQLAEVYGLQDFTPNTITSYPLLGQELAKIRQEGYAFDDQEIVEGARCIAAPIFSSRGVEGALSLSGAMHRFSDAAVPDIAAEVRRAAEAASRKLGCLSYPPAMPKQSFDS